MNFTSFSNIFHNNYTCTHVVQIQASFLVYNKTFCASKFSKIVKPIFLPHINQLWVKIKQDSCIHHHREGLPILLSLQRLTLRLAVTCFTWSLPVRIYKQNCKATYHKYKDLQLWPVCMGEDLPCNGICPVTTLTFVPHHEATINTATRTSWAPPTHTFRMVKIFIQA